MTNRISSYTQTQGLAGPNGSGSAAPRVQSGTATAATPASATPTATTAATSKSVTLTPHAQASAQLLDAARAATGVDGQAVQTLRTAIQTDTYNVPAENLATSILAALAEVQT